MNRRSNIFIIVLLTVLLLTVPGGASAGDKYRDLINCDFHQSACTQNLAGSTVTLTVTPQPVKAMQDLIFQVAITGQLPPSSKLPYIDFDKTRNHKPNAWWRKWIEQNRADGGSGRLLRRSQGAARGLPLERRRHGLE